MSRAVARDSGEVAPGEASREWEPEDLEREIAQVRAGSGPRTLAQDLGLKLIGWYQRDIATRSVPRCPFAISCSNYAARAIASHGCIVGVCLFIDRNFYRENPEMSLHYRYVELPGGVLKLDDAFFLGH